MTQEDIIKELEGKIYDIIENSVDWNEHFGMQGMREASSEITEYIIKSELLTKIKQQ